MSPITINGNTLDPVAAAPVLNALGLEAKDASKSDYILVQASTCLSREQKDQLASFDLVLHGYISENTYLYGYKETDLERIRSLPFVTWANIYLKQFKVSPDLKTEATGLPLQILPDLPAPSESRATNMVDIVFHEDVDINSEDLKSAIAAAACVGRESVTISRNKVRLVVQDRCLDNVAAIDAVRVIQKVYPVQLHNNVARSIMNANIVVNGTAYKGAGEVVAVADTGFDKGSTTTTHPAFTGRVARLYGLGRPGNTDDPNGHGTHVCGSVLGDGTSSSMGGVIQGIAPEATLVVQSLLDFMGGLGGIPVSLGDLFGPPYRNDQARVHTNSWGFRGPQRPYDTLSEDIDDFVWRNPDMVICFSAGNNGTDANHDGVVDLAQIGSTAAAKNCVTVGACESVRLEIQARLNTYGDLSAVRFPQPPLRGDPMANNSNGMAAFSSRGPTMERRFKPDVVAPGTSILSAHSRSAPAAGNGFGTSADPDWFFDTGTSMATPLVAGCAAILRETLVKNGRPRPSAALIKALLINGAVDLTGQYSPTEAGQIPNNNEGFGRVNLANSVIIPGPDGDAGLGEGGPLEEGDKDVINIKIPSQPRGDRPGLISRDTTQPTTVGPTFKITLVWTDPPELNGLLQNDLDLIVIAADGSERHGNMGAAPGFDTVNNVEQVLWTNMPTGGAEIVVRATRIMRFPQGYAYAWRISW